MDASAAFDIWNLSARKLRMSKVLQNAHDRPAFDKIIRDRLRGIETANAPKFERFERPSDIFVEVVLDPPHSYDSLGLEIKQSMGRIIDGVAESIDNEDPEEVAEIIFLAARISSRDSVIPIAKLSELVSERRLDNGEQLRSRALRALFGLLIEYPGEATRSIQESFRKNLSKSSYTEVCIAALVAIFGEDLEVLISIARSYGIIVDIRQLNLQLEIARHSRS